MTNEMKFSIAVNMERSAPDKEPRQVIRQMRELVQLAEDGGFEIAWAAEHHTIELMAGPKSLFTFLMDWAAHTSRIRLGIAVVVAPYWHPIRVAGEAALVDLYSKRPAGTGSRPRRVPVRVRPDGRRHRPARGRTILREMLPVLRELWQGDLSIVANIGAFRALPRCRSHCRIPSPCGWRRAIRTPLSGQ